MGRLRYEKEEEMKIRRFLIKPEWIEAEKAVIPDAREIHHLARVLRLKAGDPVILFDGQGNEYRGILSDLTKDRAVVDIEPLPVNGAESPLKIILGIALLKSDRLEWVIQKATEVGVSEIFPFYSVRAVPRRPEAGKAKKQARWEKIAAEAAKQCGRGRVLLIHAPQPFASSLAVETGAGTLKLIFWERERERGLTGALSGPVSTVYALVGPEGGFTDDEARQAIEAGFLSVRLGPRTLRADTAGIVAAALLQFVLGDLK